MVASFGTFGRAWSTRRAIAA